MRLSSRTDRHTTSSRRIVPRTAQLNPASRLLYRVDHYSSLPWVVIALMAAVAAVIGVGAGLGFPQAWVEGFEIGTSVVTLAMVFSIQHTQGREQAATQRKLDELLRALPGAEEGLMMLEEAPPETILQVEEDQRDRHASAQPSSPSPGVGAADGPSP